MWRGRTSDTRPRVRVARDGRVSDARPFPHVLANLVLAVLLAFGLICQPYMISAQGWHIKLEKQEAKANPIIVQGSRAIIQYMAGEAGVTEGSFILAWACGLAASTGIQLFAQDMTYGNAGGTNVYEILRYNDAWPEWDYLDDAYKAKWGTREDYEAAKVLTTFDTLGDGDSSFRRFRDDYYAAVASGQVEANPSAVDEFARGWSNGTENIVNAAHSIGGWAQDWAEGATVGINAIKSLITTPEEVFNPLGYGETNIGTAYISGRPFRVCHGGSWYKVDGGTNNIVVTPSNNVGWSYEKPGLLWYHYYGANSTNMAAVNVPLNIRVRAGSIVEFVQTSTSNTLSVTYVNNSGNLAWTSGSGSLTVSANTDNPVFRAAFNIDYSGDVTLSGQPWDRSDVVIEYDSLQDTPEDLFDDGFAFPEEYVQPYKDPATGEYGLSAGQPWPDYFTATETKPKEEVNFPENPFNPGNESGTEQAKKDTDASLKPILGLPIMSMFPFCLIQDLKDVTEKVYGDSTASRSDAPTLRALYTQGNVQFIPGHTSPPEAAKYTTLTIHLSDFGITSGGDFTLDFWMLAELLGMVRIWWQVMLVIALLWVTIGFWRHVIYS